MIRYLFVLAFSLLVSSSSGQIPKWMSDIFNKSTKPTTNEVIAGLKQALEKGVVKSTDESSQVNGYLNNPEIKIPFPEDAEVMADRLRQIGFDNEVDRFVEALNHGAEEAAKEAKPIFLNAVKSITIEDAWSILNGSDDAATRYLERNTSKELYDEFLPVVKKNLEAVHATRYYSDLVSRYNKIPFVKKVTPDLDDYATEKAIDGLFHLIQKEERKIREDPLSRTTDLLQKVFGYEG